jgi:Uncharacterised nucleotidyltransferase
MTIFSQASTQASSITTRPEIELLLGCARTDRTTAPRIKTLVQPDIDWTYLVQTASHHNVIPLLYQNLKATCPEAIPQSVQNQIRLHTQTLALRQKVLADELIEILELLNQYGILAIPFKGPVLAASVYGDLQLRSCGDLDILVRQPEILKVKELLISQGYEWKPWKSQSPDDRSGTFLKSQYRYDIYFIKWHTPTYRSCVEIHWDTTPEHIMFPLNSEHLWKSLERVSFLDTEVFNPPPEIGLPLLCTDHAKDHWASLKDICDIAEFIRAHPKMDWQQAIEYASLSNRKRALFTGLFLAHALLETALPETVWQAMQTDPVAKSLAAQIRDRLFCESSNQLGVWEKVLYNLRLRERLQDKVRYGLFRTIRGLIEKM